MISFKVTSPPENGAIVGILLTPKLYHLLFALVAKQRQYGIQKQMHPTGGCPLMVLLIGLLTTHCLQLRCIIYYN